VLRQLWEDPDLRFDRLSDLTAVDYLDLGREPRFAVVYHLMSRSTLARLRVRALVPEDDPFIDSVVGLFPSANWFEREIYDLFGIGFAGHPNLTRIMMPDDWDGHPLRKDFPIGAEAIDFSFNREGIAASHPGTLTEREERYKVDHHTLREGGDDPGKRER
jgi:NADH-quinone oxidoreductase subunit C